MTRQASGAKEGTLTAAIAMRVQQTPGNPRTEEEIRRFTDDVVDAVNRALRQATGVQDAVADLLFKALLNNDVELAFDPKRYLVPEYAAVRAEAGLSLRLTREDFSISVRIGALNHQLANTAWSDLDWSMKKELLPLVVRNARGKLSFTALKQGAAYAGRANVGVTLVRKWVHQKLPQLGGGRGRPRGLTIVGGRRFVDRGIELVDPEQRAAFIERVRKAPEEEREAFVGSLRALTEGLGTLIEELEGE